MTPSSQPARTLDLPEVGQIAIVVADLEKAIEYYELAIGLGPFRRVEKDFDPVFYRGEKISSKWLLAFAAMGPTQYELIQPVSGPSLYSEFLERHGEGLHHLGFRIKDFPAKLEQAKAEHEDECQALHDAFKVMVAERDAAIEKQGEAARWAIGAAWKMVEVEKKLEAAERREGGSDATD